MFTAHLKMQELIKFGNHQKSLVKYCLKNIWIFAPKIDKIILLYSKCCTGETFYKFSTTMKVSYEILVDVFLFSSNFGLICGKMKIFRLPLLLSTCFLRYSFPDLTFELNMARFVIMPKCRFLPLSIVFTILFLKA